MKLAIVAPAAFLLLKTAALTAQRTSSGTPREPLLHETQWGDFPLERLLPGARLRLIDSTGREVERRVVSLGDSSLELRTSSGDSLPPISFAALRHFQRIEVHAFPRWRSRATNMSLAGGVVLGMAVGAIVHNNRSASAMQHHALLDDIGGCGVIGGLIGWEVGGIAIGGRHWRRVTVP